MGLVVFYPLILLIPPSHIIPNSLCHPKLLTSKLPPNVKPVFPLDPESTVYQHRKSVHISAPNAHFPYVIQNLAKKRRGSMHKSGRYAHLSEDYSSR